jgi:hypothetical protein
LTNKEKRDYSLQLLTEIGADIEDGKEKFLELTRAAESTKQQLSQLLKEFDDLAKNINAFGSDFYDKSRLLLKAKLELCERAITSSQAKHELSMTMMQYIEQRRKLTKDFFEKKIKPKK